MSHDRLTLLESQALVAYNSWGVQLDPSLQTLKWTVGNVSHEHARAMWSATLGQYYRVCECPQTPRACDCEWRGSSYAKCTGISCVVIYEDDVELLSGTCTEKRLRSDAGRIRISLHPAREMKLAERPIGGDKYPPGTTWVECEWCGEGFPRARTSSRRTCSDECRESIRTDNSRLSSTHPG